MKDQQKVDEKRLQLSIASGQGGNMDGYDLISAKYATAAKPLRQKIAALQLQELNIRERYAALLK